jgi:hypothetical protein
MKLLLITDSHGKRMQRELTDLIESLDVYSVIVPRPTSAIRGQYRAELWDIVQYDPSVIIMHMGHNDVVFHPDYNTSPLFITAAFHLQMELASEISTNFPAAKLIISSMLPRTDGGGVLEEEALSYNRVAKRFGQMLVKASYSGEAPYFVPAMNRGIWRSLSSAQANASLFDVGGLHLETIGKGVLAKGWVEMINQATSG